MQEKLFRRILVAGFSLSAACSMAAQQTPQPTQPAHQSKKRAAKPVPKNAHKVWSDDDVASLRTPGDKYVEAKETSSPAAPTAPAVQPVVPPASPAPTKSVAQPSTSIKLPETIQKTEQVIRENTQDLRDAEDRLRQLKSGLNVTPEAQRPRQQAEIDRDEKLIKNAEGDLKVLKDHLQKLRAAQSANGGSSPK